MRENPDCRELKRVLANMRELDAGEKAAKKAELERIRAERGELGVQDYLKEKYGV